MTIALYLIAVCLAAIAVEGFILASRVTGVSLKLSTPYRPKDTEESRMNGVSKVGIKL